MIPFAGPKKAVARAKVLLYVNQVYPDDYTGQGTFERELIAAMRERVARNPDTLLRVWTVRRPGSPPPPGDVVALPLEKSRALSYVAHQVRLAWPLFWAFLRYWRHDVTLYIRYAPSSIVPVLLATVLGKRMVVRTGPALSQLAPFGKHPGWLLYQPVRLTFWWNCRKARTIVVVAEQTRRNIEALYPSVRGKIVVIPNGASLERFTPGPSERARWGLPEEGLVLGFVGHIYRDQGLDTVIRALARLRRDAGVAPRILILGNGPVLEALKALTRELGVESHVVFAGQRPYHEVPSAINSCDAMLAPFTRDTFAISGSSSLKLFEYLACDKPILASRGDDHRFLEENNVGWLVEPEDIEAWATAMGRLMEQPPGALAGRGRRILEQGHNYGLVADRIWNACFNADPAMVGLTARGAAQAHV